MILETTSPDPETLPTLGVWQTEDEPRTMVSSRFPNLPDFTCDSWCYESAMDFVGAGELEGGRVELRHRLQGQPHVLLATVVTPEPGAVTFEARAEVDEAQDAAGEVPEALMTPNLCWQLRRATGFASRPDPYPEFVKRCFIFTDDGLTFLHETERLKIPKRPAGDERNNPPWVQSYLPVWEPYRRAAAATAWADFSPNRYVYPVIGAISRDGQYLTAIANDRPVALCQAWHDCMHNNPAWLGEGAERRWRLKVYAMENDPDELLRRVGEDFPEALRLKEDRV